ncbi:STAS domain-containing protein [Vibrio sp.]|nr:STAS domain-containing protein [Vibrio sp.]
MLNLEWKHNGIDESILVGTLDRDTIPSIWKQVTTWTPTCNQHSICLQQVKRTDSAGMAFLIHLVKHAKQQNCHIMMNNIPKQLYTLFRLSNVENVLGKHIRNVQE